MNGFFVLLVFLFIGLQIFKNMGQAAKNRPGSQNKPDLVGKENAADYGVESDEEPETPPTPVRTAQISMQDMLAAAMEKDARKPVPQGQSAFDAECVGGSMPHKEHEGDGADDGRCLGGSMPHTTHEGEDAPVAVQVFEPLQRGATVTEARAEFSAAQVRQAVIMSEILDRPVSLRRNRRSI